jgi:hypothetical membrane protein
VSAALAPVFLIGGWTLAATLQPPGYRSVRDTISALAGFGATDRWLMTSALALLGLCHTVTALGLRPAAPAGRVLLAAGGVATVLVAAFPLPRTGGSRPHEVAAGIAFAVLALWPALSWRTASAAPGLRPVVAVAAAVVLLGLVGWFGVELFRDGTRVGLAERLAAGAQSVWPLVVVLTARSGG